MINKFVIKCYGMIPTSVKEIIGKTSILKPIRDVLLRQNNHYKEVSALVSQSYQGYDMSFNFFGSLQNVAKAQKKGIESTLLNHSIKLLNTYKEHQDDCVILDVGANFGFLSLVWASSVCKNSGHIYAFEPNKSVFDSFSKAIHSNQLDSIIRLESYAVGNDNKIIQLFLDNTTSNVLKSHATVENVDVTMLTLDTYVIDHTIERCDLIKIDVDGIELEILRGSIETLNKLKPIFIVETNNDYNIIKFFEKLHYKILDMDLNIYHEGGELPINIFCVPN